MEKLYLTKTIYQFLWVSSICLLSGCSPLSITIIAPDKKTEASPLPPTEKINLAPEQKVLEAPASASPLPSPTRPNPSNRKPLLQQISANPTQTARKDDIITFKVLSFEPDGDPLRLTWQATKGLLSSNQGEAVTWKPQKSDGSFESGTATITVIADDNQGGTDSISINIFIDPSGAVNTQAQRLGTELASLPQSVVVNAVETPSNEVNLPVGQEKQLSATALLSDQSRSQEILWLSSNSTIVSVSPTGQLKRLNSGDVVIFAKSLLDPTKQQAIRVTETAVGNTSPPLTSGSNTQPTPESAPPPTMAVLAAPIGITSNNISNAGFSLNWQSVSGATSYRVYQNNVLIASNLTGTSYNLTGLSANTTYAMQVSAVNGSGESAKSSTLSVTTSAPPVTLPAAPTSLNSSNLSSSGFTLGWGAVSGATSYRVYQNNGLVASNLTGTSYNLTGLSASTAYAMQVSAVNAAGESAKSGALSVTTSAPGSNVIVSTLAGDGTQDYADVVGISAKFNYPYGIALDSSGHVYVGDYGNNRIRKITPSGNVSTLAGDGIQGYADGAGASAKFGFPSGVAVDSSGNVYVAEYSNNRIRKITPSGNVNTLAGDGTQGYADGVGTSAKFKQPYGVAVDSSGNVYVADTWNHRIRKITPSGNVSTLAGSGTQGYQDGAGASAQFSAPLGVALDSSGNVYVGDGGNNRIRKITPSGNVSTLAGTGIRGYADGVGVSAKFANPWGVSVNHDKKEIVKSGQFL